MSFHGHAFLYCFNLWHVSDEKFKGERRRCTLAVGGVVPGRRTQSPRCTHAGV